MKTVTLLMYLPMILALTASDLEFSVSYFKSRNVKFVCILTCDDETARVKFAKHFTSSSIGISQVPVQNFSRKKIEICLSQFSVDIGVLVDTKCPIEELLYYASGHMLFDSTRKWLVMDFDHNITNFNNSTILPETVNVTNVNNSSSIREIVGKFEELNISVNADLVLAQETENGYQVYELYNYGKIQGGELIVKYMGIWSEETGKELNSYKYYKRWDFQRFAMRMVVVTSAPAELFKPSWLTDMRPVPGVATIMKPSGMVLHEIAYIHNFRFIYTIVDRWIGDFNRNDSHKVVATSIYYKLQDISPLLRFNPELIEKLGMLHPPLISIETRYYYRIPTYGAGKYENQFLRPLSPGAWWSVAFVSSLCGGLLLLSATVERRPLAGQYAIFSVLASVCQQFFEDNNDNSTRTSSTARKLTLLVTGLLCVIIYNYYTSSVVSWLLNGLPPSITSLEELLDSPLDIVFEDVGYARSWLQNPNYYFNKRNRKIEDLLRRKKVLVKDKTSVLASLEHGIEMVKAGGYAFHTEVDSANRLISQSFTQAELCELGSLQSMERTMLHTCVQKHSPYNEFLNWSLMRLMERGIVHCVQKRTRSSEVKCEGSSPRALALGGAAPAFLLLASGYVLATAIMLLERFAEKRRLLLLRKMLQ